jgi:hypothetical protein
MRSRFKSLCLYIAAASLPLLCAFPLLELFRADLRVPFTYKGDAMFYSMLIKGISDHGWYLTNNSLGMPYGTELHDFPFPDIFHLALIKVATWFTSDHALILNLFFLMTFPLTTVTALYVFRQFNLSYFPALLGSLLYTFTPYHLSRSENHLMYSAYYAVPLIILVILWVCDTGKAGDQQSKEGLRLDPRNRKLIFSLFVCILIASTGGVYYSFFACYLLLVIGAVQAVTLRHIRHFLLPGVLTAVIFGMLVLNLSPSIIYQAKHGKTETAQRGPADAEVYGLKIAQLVLPVTNHRIRAWAQAKDKYNRNFPLVTENSDSTLGVIGSIGFLTLVGYLLCSGLNVWRREERPARELLSHLSVLNISAVLLGTIGGFSALVALLVSPQIRGYNRISVYIAFFAFFTIVLLLDRARQRFFRTRGLRVTFGVLLTVLTILGLLDQSARGYVPDYAGAKNEFLNDAEFIKRIETSVRPGAMIFQFPVKRFPETPPIERVVDYDLLKGYLHSKQLRWSYAAMRGRASDGWQLAVTAKPLPELIEAVALSNFEGIYIDRFGYTDNAAKLENDLATLLETKPIVSKNGRLSFFTLAAYQKKLQAKYSGQELGQKREQVLYPVMTSWEGGFSELESEPGGDWRWCGPSGELVLNNPASYPRRVTVEMSVATGAEGHVRIESQFFTEQLKAYPEPQPFSKTFDVPPGKYKLRFASDAEKVYAPNDPRTLIFRLINFRLKVS